MSKVGTEWELVEKLMKMKSEDGGKQWLVTYCTPIYGAWDLICEVSFKELKHLDMVVTSIRMDESVSDYIDETTTLVSSKPNYPLKE